tara:strand:+ start:986 stop:1963 length:978 start_codon:yes stop_codon:yes gene_type:complete
MPNKILFIGLGGAGQRHLRIINKKLPSSQFYAYRRTNHTPFLNSDFTIRKSSSLEKEYDLITLENIDDIKNIRPDLTIISSPSAMHYQDIQMAAKAGSDIIVEKPGAMNFKEAISIKKLIKSKNIKFLVSFQRRFHPLVIKMRKLILDNYIGRIKKVFITTKSFVPGWHPYEDFRNLYACRKDLGGGVVPTEIHEIDIITWIFGKPKMIDIKSSSLNSYNLDVEDAASIFFKYGNLTISAEISFMSNEPQREIFLEGEKGIMKLDFLGQNLFIKKTGANEDIISDDTTNDFLFEKQLDFFLDSFDYKNSVYLDAITNNGLIIEKR